METIKVNLSKSQLQLLSELLYDERIARMESGFNNWEYIDHINETIDLLDESLDKIFEGDENI